MAVSCFVGSFAKRTGTGTQAITGVGFQPKALLFWSVLRTATGMEAADQSQIFGISDGTHHKAVSHVSQSGSLGTAFGHRNDTALYIVDTAGAADSIGVVSALGVDGFTINWTTAAGFPNVLINFLAIGGSDVTAFVGEATTNATVGHQSVTGVGFRPDCLITLAWPHNTSTSAGVGFGPNGVGWVTRTEQGAASNDTSLSVALRRYQRTDRCVVAKGGGGVEYEASAVSLDADGFTVNWVVVPTFGGGYTSRLPYLALKGVYAKAGSLTTPSASGTQTLSTAGTLKAVLLMSDGLAASTAVDTDDSEFSFGAVDVAGNQRVAWSADRDAAGTTARYQQTTRAVISANGAAVTTVESEGDAAISGQDFSLDWTITTANREQVLYLALGAVTASSYTDGDPGILAMVRLTDRADTIHRYSSVPLPDAKDYGAVSENPDGNFKAPRVQSFLPIHRRLSEATGQQEHVTFGAVLSDTDRSLRALFDDATTQYLTNAPLVVKTIDDVDRRAELPWHNEMAGYVEDYGLPSELQFSLSGTDWLKKKLAQKTNAPEYWVPLLTRDDFPNLPSDRINQAAPLWYGRVSDENEGEEGGASVPADLYPRGAWDPGWIDNGWDAWASSGTIPPDDYALYITTIKDGVESTVIAFEIGFTFGITGGIYARFLTSVTPDYFRIYLSDDVAFNPFTNPTGGSFARYIDILPSDAPTDVNPFGPADGSRYYLLSSLTYGSDYQALVTGASSTTIHNSKGLAPTIYVGEIDVSGVTKSVFLIGRGAIGNVFGVFVNGVRQTNVGSAYEIECPFLGDWAATYGANYYDINGTRYTPVLTTGTIAINAINGSAPITVNLDGIEDIGDATGTVLVSPVRIRQHFERNFLAATTVPSTTWLSVAPSLPNDAAMQDDDSYDDADADLTGRVAGGYAIGGAIGANGAIESALDVLASLCVAGDFNAGFNRIGQAYVTVEPTSAPVTAEVIALTDVLDINGQSFQAQVELTQHFWNVIPFTHTQDYCGRTETGWYVRAEDRDAASILNYDQERTASEIAGRWWRNDTTRGQATLTDAVQRRRARYRHPLRIVELTVPYLASAEVELGSILRLTHIEGLSGSGWVAHDVRVTGIVTDLDALVRHLTAYDLQPIYDGLEDAVEPTEDLLGERLNLDTSLQTALRDAQLDLTELENELAGFVTGPGTVTDNALVRFDGTTGFLVQEGAAILENDGRITTVTDPTNDQDVATKKYVDDQIGGTGGTSDTGAVGSEPGSPATGDLYFENNGFALERYSGSIWARFGPIFPLTAPVDGDFSWVNQGGASVDTTNGGIYLLGPVNATTSLRVRVKTAPSTPYTITAAILGNVLTTPNFQDIGLCFRESGTGKLVIFRIDTAGFYVTTASSPTVLVTNLVGPFGLFNTQPLFWRITDNGTNLLFALSSDGQHFIQYFSVGRTAYLAGGPDQVGFFVNEQTNTYTVGLTLASWKET